MHGQKETCINRESNAGLIQARLSADGKDELYHSTIDASMLTMENITQNIHMTRTASPGAWARRRYDVCDRHRMVEVAGQETYHTWSTLWPTLAVHLLLLPPPPPYPS